MVRNLSLSVFLIVFIFRCNLLAQNIKSNTKGQTWAVIVGVSDYEKIPSLLYADRDAYAFYDYLVNAKGGPKIDSSHIKFFVNKAAVSKDIRSALHWLKQNAQINDHIYFYFSGHGDISSEFSEPDGYLLTHETPSNPYGPDNALAVSDVEKYANTMLSEKKVNQVVVIIDACHSGKLADGSSGVINPLYLLEQKSVHPVTKFLSAQENENAEEDKQWGGGRGVFSFYLLKGLEGEANDDEDSVITASELSRYLTRNVSHSTSKKQNPYVEGSPQQILFPFNKYTLESAKADKEIVPAKNTFYTQQRGTATKLSNKIKSDYDKFLTYVRNGELVRGKDTSDSINCAKTYYLKIIQTSGDLSFNSSLQYVFLTALQEKTEKLFSLAQVFNNRKPVKNTIDVHLAFYEVTYARSLVTDDVIFYNYINAKASYFQAIFSKDFEESLSFINKSLATEPKNPFTICFKAFRLASLIQSDSAIYYSNKVISMVPKWADGYKALAIANISKSDYFAAEEAFKKAIKIDPYDALTYYDYGKMISEKAVETGDKNEANRAIKILKKTYDVDKKFLDGYFLIGNINRDMAKYQEAVKAYEKVIEIDSNYSYAYNNIGVIYNITEQYGSAIKYFDLTLDKDPTDDLAIQNLKRNLEAYTFTNDGSKHFHMGLYYLYTHESNLAIVEIEALMKDEPDYPENFYMLSAAYAESGETIKAINNLKIALSKGYLNYDAIARRGFFKKIASCSEFIDLMKLYFPGRPAITEAIGSAKN